MISVILLAGGSSSRFGENKLKALLGGIPVFLYSLLRFHKRNDIFEIIIVTSKNEINDYKILQKQFPKIKFVVEGGKERQFSVENGLKKVSGEFVLIHNGANPLVTDKEIDEVILNTKKYGASVVGKKVKNTLKKVDENGFVVSTISREDVFEVQTPQGLKTEKFKELISLGQKKVFTDDVSFFEEAGLPVKITQVSEQNFKITTKEDLKKAENFVKQLIKIGFGHDSHKIIENKSGNGMILGGIKISDDLEFQGNSDGDVLIHAICNAIGTGIGEGSLSLYSDEMCKKGITNSMKYLDFIIKKMIEKGYSIGNISVSIEGARPKLEKYIPSMKEKIAKNLFCTSFQIGIACTTGEELTSFGKGEGLQVFCNVILKKV